MNRISNKTKRILAVFLALLVLVSGSWIADGVKGEVLFLDWSGFFANRAWGLSMAFGVFLASWYGLYRLRHAFANIQSLSRHKCDPHKSLILFVSTPTFRTQLDDSRTLHFPDETKIQLSDDLDLDIKALDELLERKPSCRWNWQQILRAIQPHVNPEKQLLHLHLIGSTGDRGSFGHLDSCKKWLEGYLLGVEITKIDAPGVDFEDFNAVIRHIQETIDKQKKGGKGKVKFTDKDIVIDVTGGTAMASIAGSSSTLNTRVTFQYVQTNPPHEVYAYDVAFLPHDE